MSRSQFGSPIKLFCFTFFYVIVSGVLVQFIILPYLFPDLHAGDGLIKGMDTVNYHHVTLNLLAQMNVKGWSAWSLQPEGPNALSGLMAAIYYVLGPKPYYLLICNGLLWGITAVSWYAIFQRIFPENPQWNVIPVVLILTLPSSLQWTSQFLKDTPCITGISLFLYAFIQSAVYDEKDDIAQWVRNIGIPLLLGAFFIWLVRPYILQLVLAGSLATIPIVGLAYLVRRAPPGIMTTTVAVTIITLLLSWVVNSIDRSSDRFNLTIPSASTVCDSNFINCGVHRVQVIRDGYCYDKDKVGSAIDCDLSMTNWVEAAAYLPRAMEIAFLSPFPNMWLAKANQPGGSQMRLVAGMETTLAYFTFSLALILLISRRVTFSLPMILAITYLLMPLLIETYVNPEIGTLYRMRYIFWTGLIGISLNLIISYLLFLKQTGSAQFYALKDVIYD